MTSVTAVAHGLWKRRGAEIRVAVRVAFAGTATFALAHGFDLAQGYWAIITAVIVVQTSLGGSVKAVVERSLGTLAGALFGGAVGLFVPRGATLGLGTAVAVALAPTALLAAVDPRFRVAPVTALIVLLTAAPEPTGAPVAALQRVLEIALGNLVGVAVSLTVLPARAHRAILTIGADIVEMQARLLDELLTHKDAGRDEVRRLQAATRAGLHRLELSIDDARRERQMHLSNSPDPEPMLRTLYRLRHDLVMVGRAATGDPPEPLGTRIAPSLLGFATRAHAAMGALAIAMRGRLMPEPLTAMNEGLADYSAAIEDARTEGLTRQLTGDGVGRVFALRFALEQLVQDLRDLTDRVGESAVPRA